MVGARVAWMSRSVKIYLYLPFPTILTASTGFPLIHHIGVLVSCSSDDDDRNLRRSIEGNSLKMDDGEGGIRGVNVVMSGTGGNMGMDLNN